MDFAKMLEAAGKVREQLQTAQKEQAQIRVSGEAGGGLVRIVLNGMHEALEVHIDAQSAGLKEADLHLLEDLVRAAFNQANHKLTEQLQARMGALAGQLGIDPSLLNLTGG